MERKSRVSQYNSLDEGKDFILLVVVTWGTSVIVVVTWDASPTIFGRYI